MKEFLKYLIFQPIDQVISCDNLLNDYDYVLKISAERHQAKSIAKITWSTNPDINLIEILIEKNEYVQEFLFESKIKEIEFVNFLMDISSLINKKNKSYHYRFVKMDEDFCDELAYLCAFLNKEADAKIWDKRKDEGLFIIELTNRITEFLNQDKNE